MPGRPLKFTLKSLTENSLNLRGFYIVQLEEYTTAFQVLEVHEDLHEYVIGEFIHRPNEKHLMPISRLGRQLPKNFTQFINRKLIKLLNIKETSKLITDYLKMYDSLERTD